MSDKMRAVFNVSTAGNTDQTKKEVIDILWKFKTGNIQYADYGKLLELIKIQGMEAYAKNIAKAYAEQLFKEFNNRKEKLPEDIKKQYEDIKTTYGKIIKDNPIDALVLIYIALNYNKSEAKFKERSIKILADAQKDAVGANGVCPQKAAVVNDSDPRNRLFKPDQGQKYAPDHIARVNQNLQNLGRWAPKDNGLRGDNETPGEGKKLESGAGNDKRPEYEIVVSQNKMEQGVRNFYSAYQLLFNIKDKALENTGLEQTGWGRAAKWFLFDVPFSNTLQYFNHEYNGHEIINQKYGGRAELEIDSYLPIIGLRASRSWKRIKNWDYIGDPHKRACANLEMSASGMWADQAMARYQLENMHLNNKADHAQNLAFLNSKDHPSLYILYLLPTPYGAEYNENLKSGLDPISYTEALYTRKRQEAKNWHYIRTIETPPPPPVYKIDIYAYTGPDRQRIQNDLRLGAIWALLSPAYWRAWGNEIKYLQTGQTEFKMPKSFPDLTFTPAYDGVRYGIDYYTQTTKKQSPQVVSAWVCPLGDSYGAGVKTWYKDGSGKPAGWVEFDLWQQDGKIGGAAEIEWRKEIIRKNIAIDFILGLGYKTEGFKSGGYSYEAGVNWTAGLRAKF